MPLTIQLSSKEQIQHHGTLIIQAPCADQRRGVLLLPKSDNRDSASEQAAMQDEHLGAGLQTLRVERESQEAGNKH